MELTFYKIIFIIFYIIMIYIYTSIYILKKTTHKGNKELADYMRYPKLFYIMMCISGGYLIPLVYVFVSIGDFRIYFSTAVVGIILIYISSHLIVFQKPNSPQYNNGKILFYYLLMYPLLAIGLYVYIKMSGL